MPEPDVSEGFPSRRQNILEVGGTQVGPLFPVIIP
jgi:hypothetical protein